MCDPVTIGLTAAKTALELNAQQQASDAQEAFYHQNRINSIQARDLKIRQESLKLSQEQAALSEEKMQSRLEALRVRDKQFVSALEGGLAGSSNSVTAILRDTEGTQLRNETAISSEAMGLLAQSRVNAEAYDAEAQSRINSVQRGQGVDVFGTIAGNAIMGAGAHYAANGDLGIFSGTDKAAVPITG